MSRRVVLVGTALSCVVGVASLSMGVSALPPANPPPTTPPPTTVPPAPQSSGLRYDRLDQTVGDAASIAVGLLTPDSFGSTTGGGSGPVCRWVRSTELIRPDGEPYGIGVRVDPATGITWRLFVKICDNVVTGDGRWVPDVDGRTVATGGLDEVRKLLGFPDVAFAPPIDKMFVNIDTWMAVSPVDPVTATATVGLVSASITATPRSLEWHTGSQVRTDTELITCKLWGSTDQPACTWTPVYPSVGKATGTDDQTYHGSVVIVWDVTWWSSYGTSGTFEPLRSSTDTSMTVREIQTIGDG